MKNGIVAALSASCLLAWAVPAAGRPVAEPERLERAARSLPPGDPLRRAAFDSARRAREFPRLERSLVVNIPAFRAYYVVDGEVVDSMRVIVGSSATPTPLGAARVTAVVLNPPWTAPRGPATERIWQAARDDAAYMGARGLTVVSSCGSARVEVSSSSWLDPRDPRFAVRQAPGPSNPLGKLLFVLPDTDEIYLHDTAEPALFRRPDRALSLGCVRIERARTLAARLLAGQGWSARRIDRAIRSGRTTVIVLDRPLDVRFVYWRAWLDHRGRLIGGPDVYSLDAQEEEDPPWSGS